MNRYMFIEILKQSYSLFMQDNLNKKTYKKIIEDLNFVSYDENLSFLNLRELLITIYDNNPYYDIPYVLPKFRMCLFSLIEKQKNFTIKGHAIFMSLGILDSLLQEISLQLKSRIEMESSAHMSHIINNFYYYGFDNFNKDISFLNRNIYSGNQVFGTITEVSKYQQSCISIDNSYLVNDNNSDIDIRDLSSEENYNLNSEWSKYLKTSVKRCLSKDNLRYFREYINEVVKNTDNPKRINKLFNKQYSLILKYLKSNQKKYKESDQIILAFTQNMKKDSNK